MALVTDRWPLRSIIRDTLMPLETGTKLGPCEITGAVDAGGMGEVYRARPPGWLVGYSEAIERPSDDHAAA